jgi:YD repeat-containing protein
MTSATAARRDGIDIADEATAYQYEADGMLDLVIKSNGTVEDHDHDALGRVDQITHFDDTDGDRELDPGEAVLASFDHTHDKAGNRVASNEVLNGATRSFNWTYDALNRLVKETLAASDLDDYTHTFAYDLASNRTQQVIDSANDTLDEMIDYTHDANDRIQTETSTLAGATTYGYNAAGDRTSKTTSGGTTNYRFDVMGRLVGVDTNNDDTDETPTGTTTPASGSARVKAASPRPTTPMPATRPATRRPSRNLSPVPSNAATPSATASRPSTTPPPASPSTSTTPTAAPAC